MTNYISNNSTNPIQRESLFAATNLLCHQRFKMDAENKARVSDFIARNARGKVKVEFVKSVPDGTDRLDIRHEDKVIILAHSSDTADTIYVKVTANKVPEKAPDVQQPSNKHFAIIGGVAKYVDDLLYYNLHIDTSGEAKKVVIDFLKKQTIKGHIKALGCFVLPEGVSAQETVICGDYAIELAFAENKVNPERTPHVLWFKLGQTDEAKERERKAAYEENFRCFWKKNNLPASLLDEALKVVDVTKIRMVLVYKAAKRWVDSRMQEKEAVKFFGQVPDSGNGGFVPNRPIGYVVGDKIVITNPTAKFDFRAFPF